MILLTSSVPITSAFREDGTVIMTMIVGMVLMKLVVSRGIVQSLSSNVIISIVFEEYKGVMENLIAKISLTRLGAIIRVRRMSFNVLVLSFVFTSK